MPLTTAVMMEAITVEMTEVITVAEGIMAAEMTVEEEATSENDSVDHRVACKALTLRCNKTKDMPFGWTDRRRTRLRTRAST